MEQLDFLTGGSDATAVLQVLLPDGTVSRIPNVSPLMLLDKCPLLYHALEFGEYGPRQASLDATSRYSIISLLRWIYTGDYLAENEPSFLLNHAETFKIAENFDVPELQVSAYVNFSRQTEFSCSLKDPPVLLCETIRFVYHHFASHQSRREQSLLDTLLNYCLSVFAYQELGQRADFRQLVFDLPEFHQDLCRTSMERDFLDDGALDLVNMPVSRPTPFSQDALHKRALGDFQFELWQDAEAPAATNDEAIESNSSKRRKSNTDGFYTLVHRPKDANAMPTYSGTDKENDSSGDEADYMLVHRPKIPSSPTAATYSSSSCLSTPELVCATLARIKEEPQAQTPANAVPYEDDLEEWSLL